jgi:uncharacterized membrane protein
MNSALRTLGGAALAAAAMYWFDPTSGRRRRARLRDQLISASGDVRTAVNVGGRDLAHRIQGTLAVARSAYNGDRVNDGVLSERVRAALGRAVSHPGAIDVTVYDGRVTLTGAVLAEEFPQLMRAVQATHGVEAVHDKLSIHEDSRGVSALQGGRPRHPPQFHLLRERWPPAARLVGGAAGGMLVGRGLYMGGVFGILNVMAGGALLVRSGTNAPLKRWLGFTGPHGTVVSVHKTVRVNAPVDQVFQTLSVYENYPRFMRNVRSVQLHPDGRTRWCVAGPAGTSWEWESVTTEFEVNRLLAWRTTDATPIRHAGVMRFESVNGGTRVDVQMSYCPPGGVLGHAVAALFGADPKSELDQELLRLKSFLETGKTPRDAAVGARSARAQTQSGGPAVIAPDDYTEGAEAAH